jgi:hypothetical protein
MAGNDTAFKVTETWARAATVTSSHERDYFVEAIRQMQRQREAQRDQSHTTDSKSSEQSG